MNIIFCGNPGAGKSTICNCIFQQPMFKSGINSVTGLTTMCQEYKYNGNTYIDTPGLADVSKRKEAADQITFALKKDSKYKIIFVIILKSGRVIDDDINTIELIVRSIKTEFTYGVIINKVSNNGYISIYKNIDQILKVLPKKPTFYTMLNHSDFAEDKTDYIMDLSIQCKILKFLNNIPSVFISKQMVNKVDINTIVERSYYTLEKLDCCKQQLIYYRSYIQQMLSTRENINNKINEKFNEISTLETSVKYNEQKILVLRSKSMRAKSKGESGVGAAVGGGIGLAFFTFGISLIAGGIAAVAISERTNSKNNMRFCEINTLTKSNSIYNNRISSINNDINNLKLQYTNINEQIDIYKTNIDKTENILARYGVN